MPKFCPFCGRQAKPSAKFCSGCGNQYSQAAAAAPAAPAVTQAAQPVWDSSNVSDNSWRDMSNPDAGPNDQPPQYWESYDYPTSNPGGGYTPPPSGQEYVGNSYRPHDASRPLPPLTFDSPQGPAPGRERAREIARNFSLWAAGVCLFPIPFSDLMLLMPIQTAMVIYIGKAYGVKDPPEKTLAHIAAACGASVFGQITTLFVTNLIPIIGKMVSAPFIYGWTYGLGEVAMRYFESQGEITQDEMKNLFKQVSKEATRSFRPGDIRQANSLDHLKDHLSEDDYHRLRARFGQS